MKYSRRRYARHATRSRTKRRLVSSAPIFPSFLPFSSSHHHHAGINFTRPAREDPTESILSIQLFHTSSDFRDKILCKVSAEYGILGFHRFSLSRNNDISSKRSKRSFWNLDDREIWTKWIFKKLRKERSSGIMFLHRWSMTRNLPSTRVDSGKPSDSPSLKVRNFFFLPFIYSSFELDSIISASKYSSMYAPSDYKRTIFFNFDE